MTDWITAKAGHDGRLEVDWPDEGKPWPNQHIMIRIRRPRNPLHNAKYWSLIQAVVDATGCNNVA